MKIFQGTKSMDLLLDAMCNVFGAVLLAAILVGGISTAKKIAAPSGTVDRHTFEALQLKEKMLTEELKTIELELDILRALGTAAEPADAVPSEKISQYRRQARQINTLADQIEQLQQSINALRRQFESQKNLDEATLDKEIARLQQTSNHSKQLQPLPERSQTDHLQPWRLLLSGDQIFKVGSNRMIRQLYGADNDVKVRRYLQAGQEFFLICKQPEQGKTAVRTDLQKLLPKTDTQDYFVELLVESNAVSTAALVVEKLRQDQIPYNWRIVPATGALLRTAAGGVYEVSR